MPIAHGLIAEPRDLHRPYQWVRDDDPALIAPSPVFGGDFWLKMAPVPELRRRNDANTAWVLVSSATSYDAEAVQDVVGSMLRGAGGATIAYDDVAGTVTITTPTATTAEEVQDAVAALLVAGANIALTYDDVANTLTVAGAAGGGAALAQAIPGWRAGRYYGMHSVIPVAVRTSRAITANYVYYQPIYVPRINTVDRIGIQVITASAGSCRLGIYNAGLDGWPSTLLIDAGAVDTGTTGVKEIIIAQALQGGRWYWLAVLGNSTPTLSCWSSNTEPGPGWIGAATFGSVDSRRAMLVELVAAGFTALPATATSSGSSYDPLDIEVRAGVPA